MRVGIISDIHANAVALEAVLADIERDAPDQLVCLGDVAGTGPEPVQSIERLEQVGCPVVRGNVDADLLDPPATGPAVDATDTDRVITAIDAWCADQLSGDHERYIRSFEETIELDLSSGTELVCYHGSPRSPTEEIRSTTPDEQLNELFAGIQGDVLAGGHTHFPFARRYKGAVLLNPGSVGLPYRWDRDADEYRHPAWAEYSVVSGGPPDLRIEHRRCPLDVDAVVDAARASGMPHADVWIEGWQEAA